MKTINENQAVVTVQLQEKAGDFGAFETLNIPIIAEYGAKPLHKFTQDAENGFDWECLLIENTERIIRSQIKLHPNGCRERNLLIKIDGGIFIKLSWSCTYVFAPCMKEAERVSLDFHKKYAKPIKRSPGTYQMISQSFGSYGTSTVDLLAKQIPVVEDLELLYGEGFADWNQNFLDKMRLPNGLSIFEGDPGTGKTSYLRYLIKELNDTHRFYFIPPLLSNAVSDPEFISFWETEKRQYKNEQFVCVMEDSEGLMMKREADNRQQVVSVLNLTDGLLSDFLRIQMICTINCKASDLDQALLRPGRLTSWRKFVRHPRNHAERIAGKYGCELKSNSDYSLAEIFHSNGILEIKNERVGF